MKPCKFNLRTLKKNSLLFASIIALIIWTTPVWSIPVIESMVCGASNTLSNAPDYDWWYGCSPTSAGMMMGYYDINGYGGLYYDNLVPGGVAELSSYDTGGSPLANNAIASTGHVYDFYSNAPPPGYPASYGISGDDLPQSHDFDCLADFMGTSQDGVGPSWDPFDNPNGSTAFWYWTDGSPMTWSDIASSTDVMRSSGMYGIYEYVDYCGYGTANLYNQYIDTLGRTYGFTFQDYIAEIEAGRVVMLHVEGHSMFGYGYDDLTNTVYLHDTWSPGGQHSMTWGGTYSGLTHYGVTVFEPTGGNPIPEPATIVLMGFGILGLVGVVVRRRRRAK